MVRGVRNSKNRGSAPLSVTPLGAHFQQTGSLVRVMAGGLDQSVVDLERPEVIEFEYLQHIDLLTHLTIENWDNPHPRAYHAGAGACALPLAWQATYPKMSQVAVEVDEVLAQKVSEAASLKRRPRLKLRVGDAREVLEGSVARYDLIIRDAFLGTQTPRHLRTQSWTELVASRLTDPGAYFANIGRDRTTPTKEEVATILSVFDQVVVVTDPKVWKGQRPGNLIAAAWTGPTPDWDAVEREVRRLPLPARVYHPEEIHKWLGGTQPLKN